MYIIKNTLHFSQRVKGSSRNIFIPRRSDAVFLGMLGCLWTRICTWHLLTLRGNLFTIVVLIVCSSPPTILFLHFGFTDHGKEGFIKDWKIIPPERVPKNDCTHPKWNIPRKQQTSGPTDILLHLSGIAVCPSRTLPALPQIQSYSFLLI